MHFSIIISQYIYFLQKCITYFIPNVHHNGHTCKSFNNHANVTKLGKYCF